MTRGGGSRFEREIVQCFNRYFTEHRKLGFSYRLKQGFFNTQFVDVLVDSSTPDFYLAVECKSLKGTRLSFTSNFHKDKEGVHQIDHISEFIRRTGRTGYIAVEFRGGRKNEAYLAPWYLVDTYYTGKQKSIPKDAFEKYVRLERVTGGYRLCGLE